MSTTTFRRKLDVGDLRRMNLPEEFWRARIAGVPESVRQAVARYMRKMDLVMAEGVGLFLRGSNGVGKSATACVIAKEARARGYTVYFTSFWELRELLRARVDFDDETSILGRCREVDLLILDDLRLEDADEKWFGPKDIEGLVAFRKMQRRATIITTRLSVRDMASTKLGGLVGASEGSAVDLDIDGPNLHEKRKQSLRRVVFGD
jgi:DNA replication protein DnaC